METEDRVLVNWFVKILPITNTTMVLLKQQNTVVRCNQKQVKTLP